MGAPYTVNLDQHAARHYADKGATILLLDVPEQTHIAFDHQVRFGTATFSHAPLALHRQVALLLPCLLAELCSWSQVQGSQDAASRDSHGVVQCS